MGIDPRVSAVYELLRLAEEERRRGVEYWFDAELADGLRGLVQDARSGGSRKETGVARGRAAGASGEHASSVAAPPERGPLTQPPAESATGSAGRPRSESAGRPQWGPPPLAEGRDADWAARLEALNKQACACTECGLSRTRKHVVFGTGSGTVPLVFVGEAPGADEDRQGIPFVGRAGQLLTRIIAAIGLRREDVYICNVLKCRPPENRNPAPDEIQRCSPFLREQLEILKPKVICTLGLFATQTLLETTAPIGKLRGRLMIHKGMRILPTYHPAALLRNPGLKATVWEDVQLLRRILDE
jgi:uracil-DNA glycosylase family 4